MKAAGLQSGPLLLLAAVLLLVLKAAAAEAKLNGV